MKYKLKDRVSFNLINKKSIKKFDFDLYNMPTYEELLNQQKEFIKFLEDNYEETKDIWYIKILQKYKSIIGVLDDKTN